MARSSPCPKRGTRPVSGRSTSSRWTTRRRHRPTNYDLNVCQANARKAATDPKAVYMVGPFNSGCAEVEIPITNQGGLAQVSPANTYPGLTTNDPGTAPGEPQKYYPTGKRTYLRIVPARHDPGPGGPGGDEAAGLHARRGGRRQDAVRRRAGDADPAAREDERDHGDERHPRRPDVAELPVVRVVGQVTGGELRLHRVQPARRGGAGQGHQRRDPDRQDLRRRRRLLRRGDEPDEGRVPRRASRRCSSARWRRRT